MCVPGQTQLYGVVTVAEIETEHTFQQLLEKSASVIDAAKGKAIRSAN